jgi:hypothetical protein
LEAINGNFYEAVDSDLIKTTKLNGGSTIAIVDINTLRTGDADLRLYITTVQDG